MSWEKSSRKLQVPAKRFRIGELVRYSPFSRQTIHNYTIMGLIREAEWTEGGHRLYDESVFDRLSRIMELRENMSLSEIRRTLIEEERTQRAAYYDDGNLPRGAKSSPPSNAMPPRRVGEDFMSSDAT
jgi:DNA-binding transcriptional MerR regulator